MLLDGQVLEAGSLSTALSRRIETQSAEIFRLGSGRRAADSAARTKLRHSVTVASELNGYRERMRPTECYGLSGPL